MKLLLILAGILLVAMPLSAQEASSSAPPAGPKTLAAALAQVNWDAAQRGALLVVNPQGVSLPTQPSSDDPSVSGADQPLLPIPELTARGYDIRALADYFAQKFVREGEVTVVAPQMMTVFNTHPGPPNIYAGLRRYEAMTLLEGTLTQDQWKKIGSKEGLGSDGMTEDQRQSYQAILPDPFIVDWTTTQYIKRKSDPAKTFHLTEAQRTQVRLRIVLETHADANLLNPRDSGSPAEGRYTTFPVLFDANRDDGPKEFLDLVGDPEYSPHPDGYGQQLSADVPNRLKPGQLNLDAPGFARTVSLESVHGKLTIADLLQRIGTAAHQELYADPRIGRLSVWTRGASARCSDVLKSLCLGCTSTFRQVGPAYLLTDDVAGIGVRRAVIDDWKDDADAQLENLKEIAYKRMREIHPEKYLTWADDEPLKLSPDIFKQVTTSTEQGKYQDVALTALTPEQQQFIKDAASKLAQQDKGQYAVSPDHLSLDVSMWQSFVIPGLGEAVMTPVGGILNNDPAEIKADENAPLVLPPNRILYLAPANPKEAIQAIQEAQKRGFTALWVQIPTDGNLTSLTAAIKASQKVQLPVYAVMHLLSQPPGTPDSAINILGEPLSAYVNSRPPKYYEGDLLPKEPLLDWAPLDDPGLFQHLQTKLLTLAKTPGLAGLVLRDTAAPGFDTLEPEYSGRLSKGAGAEVDYAPDIRLAFLRRYGADPIDIVPYNNYGQNNDLGLFRDDDDLAKQWRDFRYEANVALLTRLYASIRHVRPALPVLLQAQTRSASWPEDWSWYGTWDKPKVLPHLSGGLTPGQSAAASVRSQSTHILFSYRASSSDMTPKQYATGLRSGQDASGKGWDGMVLDLSDCSMEKVGGYLDAVGLRSVPVSK